MGLLAGCENQADDSEPPSPHSILEARLHETEIEIAVGVLTNPDSVLSSKLFDPEFDRERSELKSVLQTAKTTHK